MPEETLTGKRRYTPEEINEFIRQRRERDATKPPEPAGEPHEVVPHGHIFQVLDFDMDDEQTQACFALLQAGQQMAEAEAYFRSVMPDDTWAEFRGKYWDTLVVLQGTRWDWELKAGCLGIPVPETEAAKETQCPN